MGAWISRPSWAMLATGFALLASPAVAAPFAYVANGSNPEHCLGDRHGHQHRGGHGPGGELPRLGSPSPRTGNTPTSRINLRQTMFR